MSQQTSPTSQPTGSDLRATYRAFLARGMRPAEAANLTAVLQGLPSTGVRWTIFEVEAIVQRRRDHEARRANPAALDDGVPDGSTSTI
jgi:hypothetical protein